MGRIGHIDADSRLCWALAGLEAGILGGLCLLFWQACSSLVGGEDARIVSVDLVSGIFGRRAPVGGTWASAAAVYALQLLGGGSIGMLFGLLLRAPWAWRRMLLLGLLAGLTWYYLAYEVLLRTLAPARYPPVARLPLIVSHLVFGVVLSAYPRFLNSLRQDL